jgi:hypothetical protein
MDDEHPVTITLPRLKPIWAAWVAGQLLFCCGVVEAFVPESRVSAALVLAGLSFMLDCVIVLIEINNKRERKRRGY